MPRHALPRHLAPRHLAPRHLRLLAAALLLAAPLPAAADPECDGSNAEMTACAWQAYQDADAELNQMWPEVLATIQSSDWLPADAAAEWKQHLIAAQRAWVKFKEEDCNGATAYEWYGGTGANAAVASCLYEKTRARIDDLRARYLGGAE
jgi:uncharacterized protein YecT (DUF1311 family)